MQQHSLHQAVIREGARTPWGVRGHVPRPLWGSQQICYQRTPNAHDAYEPWALKIIIKKARFLVKHPPERIFRYDGG